MLLALFALTIVQSSSFSADYGPPDLNRVVYNYECGAVDYTIEFQQELMARVDLENLKINDQDIGLESRTKLRDRINLYRSIFTTSASCDLKTMGLRVIFRGYIQDQEGHDPDGGVPLFIMISKDGQVLVE